MIDDLRNVFLNLRRVGDIHFAVAVCVGSFQEISFQGDYLRDVLLNGRDVRYRDLSVAVRVAGKVFLKQNVLCECLAVRFIDLAVFFDTVLGSGHGKFRGDGQSAGVNRAVAALGFHAVDAAADDHIGRTRDTVRLLTLGIEAAAADGKRIRAVDAGVGSFEGKISVQGKIALSVMYVILTMNVQKRRCKTDL